MDWRLGRRLFCLIRWMVNASKVDIDIDFGRGEKISDGIHNNQDTEEIDSRDL